MAVLKILEYPDVRLRKVAEPVDVVTDEIRQIIDDMAETMYGSEGVGLAATQVDIHRRIVVMDVSEAREEVLIFINPEYEPLTSDKTEHQEGCLSIPGTYESVSCRYDRVRVRALNRHGEPFELDLDGLGAVCIQHECDHLEGKLFVDYLSLMKQERIRKRLKKKEKERIGNNVRKG